MRGIRGRAGGLPPVSARCSITSPDRPLRTKDECYERARIHFLAAWTDLAIAWRDGGEEAVAAIRREPGVDGKAEARWYAQQVREEQAKRAGSAA